MNKQIMLYDEDSFNFPNTLVEIKELCNKLLSEVSELYKDKVQINIDSYEEYRNYYSRIQIYYYRPPTAEEVVEGNKKDLERVEKIREEELEELKRLQEIYCD